MGSHMGAMKNQYTKIYDLTVSNELLNFINDELLKNTKISSEKFWKGFDKAVHELTPKNKELIRIREELQKKIDNWHIKNKGNQINIEEYKKFLKEINYLKEVGPDFKIKTKNVDEEITSIAGPQLVVPIMNERYALNAANARWMSLYDSLYGTDLIEQSEDSTSQRYDPLRGEMVIKYGRDFLEKYFPLESLKWHKVTGFKVTDGSFIILKDNEETYLTKIYIPLQFWFCKNPGLAIPLIALQYHEVKINIKFHSDPIGPLVNNTNININVDIYNISVFCDYIFLDTDERRRFAQVSHEYLIEQVQYQAYSGTPSTLDLNFNHPVKELVWTGGVDAPTGGNVVANSGPSTPETVGTGTYTLKLNGHERFSARDATYFTRVQVMDHHSGYGSLINDGSVAVYSFALKPEEHQPSGTCNFSRIDNAQLIPSAATAAYNVYAVNYNVLRIMSGMGGLAYSN